MRRDENSLNFQQPNRTVSTTRASQSSDQNSDKRDNLSISEKDRREKLRSDVRHQEQQIRHILDTQKQRLEPHAQPPSSAPPPPPLNDPSYYQTSSYQHNPDFVREHASEFSHAAPIPRITHYNDYADSASYYSYASSFRQYFSPRGDASLRPNIGETNSYDYALCGISLRELLDQIRLANIVACSFSLLTVLLSWLLHLLTFQWSKLVLECYLAFLASLLLMKELLSIWKIEAVDHFLRDQFGILYRPLGRSMVLFLLSTLCFGTAGSNILLYMNGLVYLVSGTVLLIAYFMYQDLRRDEEEENDSRTSNGDRQLNFATQSWSYFSTSLSSMLVSEDRGQEQQQQQQETTPLVHENW